LIYEKTHGSYRALNFKPTSINNANEIPIRVEDLILKESMERDELKLKELFKESTMNMVLNIPLTSSSISDKIIWVMDSKGKFLVKLTFKALQKMASCGQMESNWLRI